MLAYVLLIMIAWLVAMPLWLSITITVISGLMLIAKIVRFTITVYGSFGGGK